MATARTKIAIACQGGGSQTAFTAGVLKGLFEEGVHRDFQITSLSGTSGGSICAALAWYALPNIGALMADGEKQARLFLKERAGAHG